MIICFSFYFLQVICHPKEKLRFRIDSRFVNKVLRRILLAKKEEKLFMTAKNYIMRRIIIFILHLVSFRMVKSKDYMINDKLNIFI
jgi:hypothetical protein